MNMRGRFLWLWLLVFFLHSGPKKTEVHLHHSTSDARNKWTYVRLKANPTSTRSDEFFLFILKVIRINKMLKENLALEAVTLCPSPWIAPIYLGDSLREALVRKLLVASNKRPYYACSRNTCTWNGWEEAVPLTIGYWRRLRNDTHAASTISSAAFSSNFSSKLVSASALYEVDARNLKHKNFPGERSLTSIDCRWVAYKKKRSLAKLEWWDARSVDWVPDGAPHWK